MTIFYFNFSSTHFVFVTRVNLYCIKLDFDA